MVVPDSNSFSPQNTQTEPNQGQKFPVASSTAKKQLIPPKEVKYNIE